VNRGFLEEGTGILSVDFFLGFVVDVFAKYAAGVKGEEGDGVESMTDENGCCCCQEADNDGVCDGEE